MPLEPAKLTVTADCERLTVQFLACGTETEYTDRVDEMRGQPIGPPLSFGWKRKRSGPHSITLTPGAWVSGVYAAKLTKERRASRLRSADPPAPTLGTVREAVVMPTNTWQAYNFDDSDGDGWGDTWYAGGNPPVRLTRPYRQRGTPPWFRRSDVPFLKFLRGPGARRTCSPKTTSRRSRTGTNCAGSTTWSSSPGTPSTSPARIRRRATVPRPGRPLIFLSANNFFWKVEKNGQWMRRVKLWRELGRPESALLGVQYRANDNGTKQGVYRSRTPRRRRGCSGHGLVNGGTLGKWWADTESRSTR